MDMDAENIQPGCDGLLFHPYLQGELTPYADPDLRASFTGVRTYHTKGHFNRAVLEGVAFSLKDCITVIDELGIKFNDVKIIGGGSKSPLWRQIVSDVIGLELIKNQIDDSSFGSAMLAGIAVGVFSSYEDAAQRCIEVQSIVKPDNHNNKKYEKYFELYKEIQSALAPIYRKIEGLI
jgi:xylulokinase